MGANINDPFSVVALNYSYSDSGLFGALIAAPAATAGHIVECAVRALKSGNVPDENIKRGEFVNYRFQMFLLIFDFYVM